MKLISSLATNHKMCGFFVDKIGFSGLSFNLQAPQITHEGSSMKQFMFTPSAGMFYPKVYNATLDFTPQHRQDLAFNKGASGNPAKFPYDGG